MNSPRIFLSLSILVGLSACARRMAGFGRAIDVQGHCTREVAADRGQIELTSVVLDKDIGTAAKTVSERYTALMTAIEDLKLKDVELRTTQTSVQERRDWVKDHQISRGFEARMSLRVTSSEIVRLGEVIRVAGEQSVPEIGSIRSFVSTALQEGERGECLKQAVQNARRTAEAMAQSLGASIGNALRVSEGGVTPPNSPMPEMMAMSAGSAPMAKMAAPQIQGGREELSYAVTVTFELR